MIKKAGTEDSRIAAESLKFHLQLGFEEANRIICFKKNL